MNPFPSPRETTRLLEQAAPVIDRTISRFARGADRDDLAQSIRLDLLRGLGQGKYNPRLASFPSWARMRAWSRAVDWLRKSQRERRIFQSLSGLAPNEMAQDHQAEFWDAMVSPPLGDPFEARIFRLRLEQLETGVDIAKELGLTDEALKYLWGKIRSKIRPATLTL